MIPKTWTLVQVMTWPDQVMLHITRIVSMRQTPWSWFDACISSQWKLITQKPFVTLEDVTWPDMHLGEVTKLTRTRSTYIGIPKDAICRYHHSNQLLKVSSRSRMSCSCSASWLFLNMRSLDLTWWPDLERSGAEIFTQSVKRMSEKVRQKPEGCPNIPPARRGLT